MQRILFTAFLFFLAATCYSEECVETDIYETIGDPTLPIFHLTAPEYDQLALDQISQTLLNQQPLLLAGTGPIKLKSQTRVVEIKKETGDIWFADKEKLWNPNLKPTLPKPERARQLASAYLEKLLPKSKRSVTIAKIDFSNIGKTWTTRYNIKDKTRTSSQQLDIQVNYDTHIRPFPEKKILLPIIGGIGEMKLTFGDNEQLIGLQSSLREFKKMEKDFPVIPKEKSDAKFKELLKDAKLRSFRSYLAYKPSSESNNPVLYPVYAYQYSIEIEGEVITQKILTLPATTYGAKLQSTAPPQKSRTSRHCPRDETVDVLARNDPDAPIAGSTGPEGDDTANGAREVGISWIQGKNLEQSGSNAEGFLDELVTNGGWTKNFNWGEDNAWSCDWVTENDDWVDAADFVYYAGHADRKHWEVRTPDNSKVTFHEVGDAGESPGDVWGNEDLEWIIINACGPLQDDLLNGGTVSGSVFDRWSGAFDGLHQLLGYGSVVFDEGREGRTVAKYMLSGETIINSWFRTAQEVQRSCNGFDGPPDGPRIWAGVLYAEPERTGSSTSVFDDHLWTIGPVAPDPIPADVIFAMWTST